VVAAEDDRTDVLVEMHVERARDSGGRREGFLSESAPSGRRDRGIPAAGTNTLPRSSTANPSARSPSSRPATRIADGPISTPRRPAPRSRGTPRTLIRVGGVRGFMGSIMDSASGALRDNPFARAGSGPVAAVDIATFHPYVPLAVFKASGFAHRAEISVADEDSVDAAPRVGHALVFGLDPYLAGSPATHTLSQRRS
jgi:hypothetical protein